MVFHTFRASFSTIFSAQPLNRSGSVASDSALKSMDFALPIEQDYNSAIKIA
jgi:hypothetical protein